jgi:(1->4)-alpha-D-glucan 1-alpha-D-glucosylmutase
MSPPRIPAATYRLQFNRQFTFRQATAIVPYLAALGISHVYASPYLRARPGSMHGYDIIDHNQLNPEIGTPEEFEEFVDALHRHDMGQILDIVPNHMGVMGSDNAWWLDVLENGESSDYAQWFDIDWQPLKDELQGKVLIPVLDDQYGIVLDKGELKLVFDQDKGELSIWYQQHRFPVDPKDYPRILLRESERLAAASEGPQLQVIELQSLVSAFSHLPGRTSTTSEERTERNRDKEILKRRLADLCARSATIAEFVQQNVRAVNGTVGDARSFDELHELIKAQAFRLAYWRVAADDINYRRFFDINDLAGLRMENPSVFEATHRFVMELVRQGKVDGLRIDHPDGLFDPAEYFRQIAAGDPGYVVVEKILTGDETLPSDWAVHGTTGYDFSNLLNGLFVDTSSAAKMGRAYRGFLGQALDFRKVVYESKQIVMRSALASELQVLASMLSRIALANRYTCDFTLNSLRDALSEVVANFPVYRTYVREGKVREGKSDEVEVSGQTRWYIEVAIQAAKKRDHSQDTSVYDFMRRVFLITRGDQSDGSRHRFLPFAMKFQQFSSPVMAKGLEDTSFYRYHPLASLNDVGGDPTEFGRSPGEFHKKILERSQHWPHSMLGTSTHDSKLSEDVRARINVLSEIPAEWRLKARQWHTLNLRHKKMLDGVETPSRNDEYLFYQALLGVWPRGKNTSDPELLSRMQAYMLKASREAKESTSWANQNAEYESALQSFVDAVLDPANREFVSDFLVLEQRVAGIGMLNTLSQTLIKLASPGVPDIYQGNEVCEFRLVDPDNRQPVDYQIRKQVLADMTSRPGSERRAIARHLSRQLEQGDDGEGRAKLFLTWSALMARQRNLQLFQQGEYVPLTVQGERADRIFAFARTSSSAVAVVAVPRLCARLFEKGISLLDSNLGSDNKIVLPQGARTCGYRNAITGQPYCATVGEDGTAYFNLSTLMKDFPWVLLLSEAEG